jgi:hypothetical protein
MIVEIGVPIVKMSIAVSIAKWRIFNGWLL